MLEQDDYTITSRGSGYTVGELKSQHRKLRYLEAGTLVGNFDGLDTMLDFVAKEMPEAKRGKSSIDTVGDNDEFHAFRTYKETMDIFRGKPETVVKFDPAELSIKDQNESGTQVDYDVTGSFIDMGRYMEGIPEVMGDMHNGNARNRRCNITIDINNVWSINHEDITHRSERILRLIDALEAGGIRTQLTMVHSNECDHVEIILKHHEEPLTITDLAVVTHPEFLRRIMFRFIEHSKSFSYGYGRPGLYSDTVTPEMIEGDNVNEIDIAISGGMSGKSNIDKRFDEIEKLLVWEMSKPVPEVGSIKLNNSGIYFSPNGTRSDDEIKREGLEAIHAE